MSETGEKWLPVPDYEESYEVSSRGRVRSFSRRDALGHQLTGRLLRIQCCGRRPRLTVKLYCDGHARRFAIRTLQIRVGFETPLRPWGKR